MATGADTPRTTVRRLPEKQVADVEVLHAILDAAYAAQVGFQTDGQPFVLPMACARDGDQLLLHGSTASRLMRALADGAAVCVNVMHLDGLVYARSAFESSMNYRSATVLGVAERVPDDEKLAALERADRAPVPGPVGRAAGAEEEGARRHPDPAPPPGRVVGQGQRGVRRGRPGRPRGTVWAGVVPFRMVAGEPEDAPDLAASTPVPDHVLRNTPGSAG